jgi:hypothetical protein
LVQITFWAAVPLLLLEELDEELLELEEDELELLELDEDELLELELLEELLELDDELEDDELVEPVVELDEELELLLEDEPLPLDTATRALPRMEPELINAVSTRKGKTGVAPLTENKNPFL